MLMAACKLQGGLHGWDDLVRVAGESCSTVASCHRTLTNCVLAIGKEGQEGELVNVVRTGEAAARERALSALGRREVVGREGKAEVETLLMKTMMAETSSYEEKVAALSSSVIGGPSIDEKKDYIDCATRNIDMNHL